MATVYFPSLTDVDAIEVEFLRRDGTAVPTRLLVDSGFTGLSGFVLGLDADKFAYAFVQPSATSGALQGTQRRAWVTCRIPSVSYEGVMTAMLADLSTPSLPSGIHGIAGLTFLRQFARWGAERTASGGWRFFLSTDGG